MTRVKELYMGKRMEDLDKFTVIDADVQKTQMKFVLSTAKKLLEEADKNYREGDEELAYIKYMRYFNLLSLIKKKPDYLKHKQLVRESLGNNTSNSLNMDKLEALTMSLRKRYESFVVEKTKPPPPISDADYDQLSASEKFDRLLSEGTGSTAVATQRITGSPRKHNEPHFESLSIITCKELFERTKEQGVLIMDCRPSDDYKLSHLTYQFAFNVPEELISLGMSAGMLQAQLADAAKPLWAARSVKNYVVLMDWNSQDGAPSETSPIGILLNILKKWDPDVTYRSPIRILEGGYEYFIMMYPTLCTNPSVQSPQKAVQSGDIIDDIEYPSINDITMKTDIIESLSTKKPTDLQPQSGTSPLRPPTRPSVDRSSKLAAIKVYEEKQKPLKEIMKEHEELMVRAQQNDEQLHEASSKWRTIFENGNAAVSPKAAINLTTDQQQLLYKIIQLESAAEDYKMENYRLREELDNYRRHEQSQKLDSNEAVSLAEATKKIESKSQERQKLVEQQERERREREAQLAIAREQKRHMKPPTDEEEEMSKPKIPQFDRSAKPQFRPTDTPESSPVAQIERRDRYRDFSPKTMGAMGPGLTGLKNLGNTCYMNSILQCLSNTPQLTEYCITDKYKNHISRTNKTKGQIIEEVAALIKILWNGNYKCVASKDLRYVIGQYQEMFSGMEQQDSHEFLTILMDWLHSDLQTLMVPEKLRPTNSASERAWLEFTKAKESLILHLFYGQIKSTVKCAECFKESATYESFSNLSLELPSTFSGCYLSQCMDMYFSGEPINGWNCPNCKQKRNAIKKLDISKLPPVLVIHLKRFYADPDSNGNAYRKKQTYVRFPLEDMDMTPYIAKSKQRSVTQKTYQLYGVSNHYGSMEGGHYTAFCKSGINGRWHKFDDQVVTPIDSSSVVSSAAYILFYTWLPPIQINDSY